MAGREHTKGWERFTRELGDNITRVRESKGLSQEHVAFAAGLSRHTYQRLEKGLKSPDTPTNPTLYTLLAVCRVLGVHLEDILPSYSGSIFTPAKEMGVVFNMDPVPLEPRPGHDIYGKRFR